MRTSRALLCFTVLVSACISECKYQPNWSSIDSRPLPAWYDEAKVGVFMHWGVFSVPSFGETAWLWAFWQRDHVKPYVDYMTKNYRPGFTYADFAPEFKAEFFNPDEWAEILEASGAKYFVITTKHHEGFTLWPSKVSFNWNAMQVGPKRDLIGELATAIRNKTSLHFGLYHSLFAWFDPLYVTDKSNNFKTQLYPPAKAWPELYELVNNYKPEILWSDGDAGPDWYWNSTQFLAWLYNESPVKDYVVTNDRWGNNGIMCHHGGYYTCADRYNPGKLQNHKWENAMTLDRVAWAYRRTVKLSDLLSMEELIYEIASTVSCGGNILVNVGPTAWGTIVPIFEQKLRQMGEWLKVNGEAIYSTKPWSHQNDTVTKHVWYTSKKTGNGTAVYAIVLKWPTTNTLTLGAPIPTSGTVVTMLGYAGSFGFKGIGQQGITIRIPVIPFYEMPCQWGWVFKLEGLKNAASKVGF
ncbi:alpha-L-fucosidase [Lingula anatina]|uniref:alpha-L-fucosidase n=1 Tax=Lingula anatina TaxID=7574 RepID=A0A1S3I5Z0_LINAN|nr:alpha-L-fucosidase [Lingula anatina]|eukprot:XP_013393623.1 alpha-L-fucosidase [Lingula anatina]